MRCSYGIAWIGWALASVALGCGGSAPKAPESPQQLQTAAPVTTTGQPAAEPASELPSSMPKKTEPGEIPSDKMSTLLDELSSAEALTSGRDCAAACRALRSMQSAVERLCSIAQDDQERERCRDSQERVKNAKQRVRGNCTRCAEGPSLEGD